MTKYDRSNLMVFALQFAGWFSIIALLHQPLPIAIQACLIIVFCLMMQGVFSLMHECFHGKGQGNRTANWALGTLASTIFGTAYTLFAVNHEGHHVRNRTRAELVDYIYPDESAAKKIFSYYIAIFGGIWLAGFIAPFLMFILPHASIRWLSRNNRDNTYAKAFSEFSLERWNRTRIETILFVLFWLGAFRLFHWDWKVVGTCYAAFAFSWSSLQWVYHVRTPIDTVEGAYNLRLPPPVRALFLNFNYNLTHHRHPHFRWQELYQNSNQEETQPLWYRYLGIFYWPQPLPKDPSLIQKRYF